MPPAPGTITPFLLEPHYVPKPWGGRRLATELGRSDLPDGPIGESWDVVDLPDVTSIVDGGAHDGLPLAAVWGEPFPLLVKVLDAGEDLSVQVHPDEASVPAAKEEIWVALADGGSAATGRLRGDLPAPGAWRTCLTRHPLAGARGRVPPTLVHVPAGTVHALLAGSLIWEVQTPAPTTWRLDDHGRLGLDGHPRALHLEEARGVLARGPEAAGRLDPDGCGVRGTRLAVWSHPPGVWDPVPGCVGFFLEEGEVGGAGGRASGAPLVVPRGRTVVLPRGAGRAESTGWMLAADRLV